MVLECDVDIGVEWLAAVPQFKMQEFLLFSALFARAVTQCAYDFAAVDLVAHLLEQARKFMPEAVVIADENKYPKLKEALADLPIKVYGGYESICQIVESKPIDIVVTAMVGFSGLRPTINAIKAGKAIALANKETMVVAGEMINELAMKHQTPILPVDSEHSAIFQCLAGEMHNKVEKLILTASGGPFRTFTKEQLEHVTREQALKHPNWSMGAKITIDSASMMNKGFEVMEAKWLFGVGAEDIEVVIHPQSVIHSMVQFGDGAIKAQLGTPDMRLPIMYALTYPVRLPSSFERVDWNTLKELTFEKPDLDLFPNLRHAYTALAEGGNIPCVVNAANEICVAAFLEERIKFTDMPKLIERAMEKATYILKPTLDDYLETDREIREMVKSWI